MAKRIINKNIYDDETKRNEIYVVDWTKKKLRIEGVARLVQGPRKNSQVLMVGYDTRVNAPPSALNLGEGSLAIWARLIEPTNEYSTLVRLNNSSDLYIYRNRNGTFSVIYSSIHLGTTSLAITDDQWHHYVFTWQDGKQKFYIDGKEKISGILPAFKAVTGLFAIGWLGNRDGDQWHGPFVQLLTFDCALLPYQVTTLHLVGLSAGQ
jgi:hypothetical protein